ncbi:MAG: branched-chain amino acid ABC transporter permease [Acidobacteria bacterium]|nr:branched-chain amino acid ABC transporter permease [Acidobacteriota bacterium]
MTVQDLATLIVSAILTAGLYATMSYGLALIYGVMRIINLAHAGVMMLAAYMTFWLVAVLHLNPFLAPCVVVPTFFLLGLAMHRFLIRPLGSAPMIASLLLLFGVWLIMQNIAYLIFSSDTRSIFTQYTLWTIHAAGIPISFNRLMVFAAGVIALISLHLFLTKTYPGRAIRALAVDPEAAILVGINTSRMSMLAFGLGIALASLAGCLMSLIFSFDPDFGRSHLLKSFCIVVLGGLESFVGVALGSLVLALVEAFSVMWLRAALQDFVSFALLVLVLLVMPNGLMSLFRRRA